MARLVLLVLAVLIGVFAVLVLYVALDPHAHRCLDCGLTWRHCALWNSAGERQPRSLRAHTCKRCGVVQWWRTREDRGPT